MAQPRTMISENLDYIFSAQDANERLKRFHAVNQTDATFLAFLRMNFVPGEEIVGLPEGEPANFKPETDLPDGTADTQMTQEYRRIRKFQRGQLFEMLAQNIREKNWLAICMGLHYKETAILNLIKDRKLAIAYPDLPALLGAAGILDNQNTTI